MYKNNGYYLQRAGGQVWLLSDGSHSEYIHPVRINEVGECIWTQLLDGGTCEETASYIADTYGISYEEAYSDVKDFTDILIKKGCLYVDGGIK